MGMSEEMKDWNNIVDDNNQLRATITEQAARIKALEDALLVCKRTLNLVRNEGYNLPGSSITYALGKINELI